MTQDNGNGAGPDFAPPSSATPLLETHGFIAVRGRIMGGLQGLAALQPDELAAALDYNKRSQAHFKLQAENPEHAEALKVAQREQIYLELAADLWRRIRAADERIRAREIITAP